MLSFLRLLLTFWLLACLTGSAVAASNSLQDLPGAQDIVDLPRFADSILVGYRVDAAAESTIPTAKWGGNAGKIFWQSAMSRDGQRSRLLYLAPRQASAPTVIAYYQNTLESQGYQLLFQCAGFQACGKEVANFYTNQAHGYMLTDSFLLKHAYSSRSVREPHIVVGHLSRPDADRYVFIFAAFQDNHADSAAGERVAVFVEQLVTTEATTPALASSPERPSVVDAVTLAQELTDSGHAVLSGLLFDANQPGQAFASCPQLDALAELLREQPDLTLYIVGHTDNQGLLVEDMEFSRRRASEVVQALARDHQIAIERLIPMGVAGLTPRASNATEAGRIQNRRVEIVVRPAQGLPRSLVGIVRP